MPATEERANFVVQEFRSAVWTNTNVRDLYGKVARDTKDSPIPTFFDNMWDVQAVVDERGALLGQHARAFKVTAGELMDLSADLDMSQVLPVASLDSVELVANFAVAVSAIESYDTEGQRTALAVWGVCAEIDQAPLSEGDTDWEPPTVINGTLVLLNPSFETGALSPWVNLVGSGNVTGTYFGGDQTIAPYFGSYMFNAIGAGGTATFGQDVLIPSTYWAQIDAGDAWLSNVSGRHNPGLRIGPTNDTGRIFAAFLDGSSTIISTAYSSANMVDSVWTLLSLPVTLIPPDTRTIRIGAELVAEDGTHDNFFDHFSQPVIVDTFTVDPTISTDTGFFAEGDTATVSYAHRGTSTSFQWKRDGVAISGATLASYTYQSADVGHLVTCTVTATTGAVSVSASATAHLIGTPTYVDHTRIAGADTRIAGTDTRIISVRTA